MPANVTYETPEAKAKKVVKKHKSKDFDKLSKVEQNELIAALLTLVEAK